MSEYDDLKNDKEFNAQLRELSKLGADNMRKYLTVFRLLNFVVSTFGVLTILFVLIFPVMPAIVAGGVLIYQSAKMSSYFGFLRACVMELIEKEESN